MDKEKFGNINTLGKESDAADISSVKRQIIDLDKTPRSNIELFQQACRDFVNSPSIQLHLNDTHQAMEQLLYTNSEPWEDHEDDTEVAAGSREAVKNIINSFWSQMANGIDKAINIHLHTRISSILRIKQTNKKLLDYIAAKHTSKLYKLLKDLKRFHRESSNIVGTEAQSFSLMDTERYWKLKFLKYNRDYSDASLIHFFKHRNFMITDLDIKDPQSINQLEDHIKTRRKMDQAIRKFIQSRSIAEAIEKRHE
ncbi:hypothetical protein RclHR1_36860001 [Rhizophagus clarus]|nr:hypothetical protein RclHR1_36860001 [Rhizophagus clarus]